MSKNRLHKGHSNPAFLNKFKVQLRQFNIALLKTEEIEHNASKGTEREFSIEEFFRELLPTQYEVAKAEAVDLYNERSPQLDVVIFDKSKNRPLYNSNSYLILPAEAVLASVESKSVLSKVEIKKSVVAAQKLKALKPNKMPLTDDVGSVKGSMRYYHSVFAFDTDLGSKDWAAKEYSRFCRYPNHAIDILYVLDRGLINFKSKKWMPEDQLTSQALVTFYFSFFNFISRENNRRAPAPYMSYASELNKHWANIQVTS